ncbi:MAG: aminotransferase class I/II-fold pyridoxal phosphate-dependent enzyme [Erysipelotrichia bacterium]|nr:aminotransferase class I/II-fold pyridoxal phosphate-dependent enzyme [Erysipelotrichia bacterium]
MKYDFETVYDRRGKDALAIDSVGLDRPNYPQQPKDGFSLIPMWVADMNFATSPSVIKAVSERMEHPLFGYFDLSHDYYDSIIKWQQERNNVLNLTENDIGYENGVVGGMITALDALCSPGESVLVHSPTYIGFIHSISTSGYNLVYSPLVRDINGIWRMDYEDMDRKIKRNNIHAAVFCSPHNPCGRVWERWEIEKAMDIYRRNDVIVISDEIWSDIVFENHRHIPTQSVSEDARYRTIALYAPSKTFNLAGLIGSYHIIYNPYLKYRKRKESSLTHYNHCNVLSMHALIGAYSKDGAEWVNELNQVLNKNSEDTCRFFKEHIPGVHISKPEGTYMLYLDCSEWCKEHDISIDELMKRGYDVGVAWQNGDQFLLKDSIRMNDALPHSLLAEALERLDKYVFI